MPFGPMLFMAAESQGKVIWGPLKDITNLSLEPGVYLGGLKKAMVVPLLKKSALDPLDYNSF